MHRLIGLDRGQKPALLISECQVGIIGASANTPLSGQAAERKLTGKTAALAAAFRTASLPVFHCTVVPRRNYAGWVTNCALASMVKKADNIVEGSPGAAIHPDLRPHAGDIVVERSHGMSMFHGTELEWHLRGLGIQTCVLVGVSTNIALPGSANEAVARLFNTVIAEDCAAGGTAESHEMQIWLHLPLLA